MSARMYKYTGKKYPHGEYTRKQLSELCGITPAGIGWRLRHVGMTLNQAIDTPPLVRRREDLKPRCGISNPLECLECKYETCISMDFPAMKGEGANDYVTSMRKPEKQL